MAQRNIEFSDLLWGHIKRAAATRGQHAGAFVRDAAYTMARRFHDAEDMDLEPAPYHPSGVITEGTNTMMVRENGGQRYVRVDPATGFVVGEIE